MFELAPGLVDPADVVEARLVARRARQNAAGDAGGEREMVMLSPGRGRETPINLGRAHVDAHGLAVLRILPRPQDERDAGARPGGWRCWWNLNVYGPWLLIQALPLGTWHLKRMDMFPELFKLFRAAARRREYWLTASPSPSVQAPDDATGRVG